MTDLNKLRSEFESNEYIKSIIQNFEWSEEFNNYQIKDCVINGDVFDLILAKDNEQFLSGAWFGWQEKAKAQAVPEGYVLMPLEPTQEMLGAANLAPMPMVHSDSISGREKLRISTQYKAMVNVCKSGAEG